MEYSFQIQPDTKIIIYGFFLEYNNNYANCEHFLIPFHKKIHNLPQIPKHCTNIDLTAKLQLG